MRMEFIGGISRYGNHGVNYLINLDGDGDVYAEVEIPVGMTEAEAEDYGYLTMKKAICKFLTEEQIERINWFYPKAMEEKLPENASADVSVEVEIDWDDVEVSETV